MLSLIVLFSALYTLPL